MIEYLKTNEGINPQYQTEGAAGIDLQSTQNISVSFGEVVLIPTGLRVAIPLGYVGQIWPRSGHAVKYGFETLAGIIDPDYRGEIMVAMTKVTPGSKLIEEYERVAQLVVVPCPQLSLHEVDHLSDSTRGTGGFGSTNQEES
jgi:dUTP pyrophosphatase